MNDTFAATNAHIAADAAKPKKPPLTEEQKDVLRNRLAVARVKRSELARAGKLNTKPRAAKTKESKIETLPASTFTRWSDEEWLTAPLGVALQRLNDLGYDRERGAVLVTQRQNAEHITPSYRCLVCKKPVQDGRWIWKNDRRDQVTGMFTSDVLCSQICHERFSNNVKYYMDRAKAVS
jgi:hypothetical protein